MVFLKRLKLTLAYDGTNYQGWQAQRSVPTLQGVVEEKLSLLTKEKIKVIAAGRTDAGVHARGQVISFLTTSRIPLEKWPLAANSLLPPDIAVLKAEEVRNDFHPRYQARSKTYCYYIFNAPLPDVFLRRYTWHLPEKLDLASLQVAASHFKGTHDFYAFSARGRPVKDSLRTVSCCEVTTCGDLILITITANGFLYQMVRKIVGTLVAVGRGKVKPEAIPLLLLCRERGAVAPPAPPQGLFLEQVSYESLE